MFLELLPRELQTIHLNDMIQLYEFTTAAGFPDIRALGHCTQLKSARSGHCLAHLGTARQCYTCSKHISCVVNVLLNAVWCWVDKNFLVTSLVSAVDHLLLEFFMVPFFFCCVKEHKISSKLCYSVFETVGAACAVLPHLPSSLSLWQGPSKLARPVDT